jgi:hypothetical protein
MKKYFKPSIILNGLSFILSVAAMIFNILAAAEGESLITVYIVSGSMIPYTLWAFIKGIKRVKNGEEYVGEDERDTAIEGKSANLTILVLFVMIFIAMIVLFILGLMLPIYILVGSVVVIMLTFSIIKFILSRKM